ncbi:hypothetical protein CBS101457_003455 [Exobasidium rhododendri]|nr:hypothetical protein CBS101457_003455 [Exobasidium rhododendri]
MTAPTNPFTSALGAHKEEQQVHPAAYHNPHNPFVSSNSSTAVSSPLPPSTSSTNPFATSHGFEQREEASSSPLAQTNTNQYGSITDDLSGLDFGQSTNSTTLSQGQSASQFGQQERVPSTQHYESTQQSEPTFADNSSTQPAAAMTTMYAAPPGPPPGVLDTPSHFTGQGAGISQQYVPNNTETYPSLAESDEAYARNLLAEDEDRVRRRQEQRNAGRSSGQVGNGNQSVSRTGPATSQGGFVAPLPTPSRPSNTNEEKQWNTKEVYWQGRVQRIIIQNENGPCSLIALCNMLLLRGTLQLTPEDRPAVSYSYLSSLLGEHLIDVITTSGSESAMDLEAALSILPQTQTGLDVNVCFDSIHGFAVEQSPEEVSSSLIDLGGEGSSAVKSGRAKKEKEMQRGELALFKLCNAPLVHGWIADVDDKETWAAVVQRAGNYDKALDRVVAGDELAKGTVVENNAQTNGGGSGYSVDGLQPEEALVVKDAHLIRNFLEATASQLTYPGLYALSTTLQRGTTYALFRNSHLSVLYRPTEEELRQALDSSYEATDAAQPQLYQLVTDSTLESEDTIVWESVEDVDGSASRFYDGKFRQSRVQDFVGRQDASRGGGQVSEDADFAYAQQLQDRESERASRYAQQGQRGQRTSQQQGGGVDRYANGNTSSNGGGNAISRMLAARKAGKRAPSSSAQRENSNAMNATGEEPSTYQPPSSNYPAPAVTSDAPAPGEEYAPPKKDKWYKKIF